MTEPAVLVSQTGALTSGLRAVASAQSEGPVETLVTDRREDAQYYLSPATITDLERKFLDEATQFRLVVDGAMHPGQVADLQTRLPAATLRDTRGLMWEWLGEQNPVAETRFAIRQARIARRRAAAEQRDAAASGPSGTSGSLAASDERIQELRDTLERHQAQARRRVTDSYTDVDGRVVIVGSASAPTTDLWTALTEATATATAGRPAQPTTDTATVGPYTLAVTDTPGVIGDGLPNWHTEAVPGLVAALEQATCMLGVGDDCAGLLAAVGETFDVPCRPLRSATAAQAREALASVLETATYAVKLPYTDAAQALVSELHEDTAVQEVEYGDAIYLHIEIAQTAVGQTRRRVERVDGELQPLDPSS